MTTKDDLQSFLDGRLIVPPTSYRIIGPDADTPGAVEVIANNTSSINAFISHHRRMHSLSGLPQSKANYTSPDLDITYRNLMGSEQIDLLPRVQQPPPVEFPSYRPAQLVDTEYTPPEYQEELPQYQLCLLVLYQGDKIAAIDMASLGDPAGLALIYSATLPGSSYSQPVMTGQYLINGFGFIQTDVDLSGKQQAKSCLSTTYLLDAISLGQQSIPIIASPQPTTGTLTSGTQVTLYTSFGVWVYDTGLFTLRTSNVNTDQACAIGTDGHLYYGASFNATNCSLVYDSLSLDQTKIDQGLTAPSNAIATWVTAYTVNYIRYIDFNSWNKFENKNPTFTNYTAQGPYQAHFLDDVTTTFSQGDEHIVEAATPDSQDNITEIQGESFYGLSTYGTQLSLAGIHLSYDTVYYYTFSIQDNYYEYLTSPTDVSEADFSGSFPRMVYNDQTFTVSLNMDSVTASAINVYELETQTIQNFPDWGGSLFSGHTPLENYTTYYDYDQGGGVQESYSSAEDVVAHTTVIDQPGGSYTGLTFDQAHAHITAIIEMLSQPQGGIAPILAEFSGSSTTTTYEEVRDNWMQETTGFHNWYNAPPYTIYIGPTTNTSGSGAGRNPPGYKAQVIDNQYNASISWCGITITAEDSLTYPGGGTGVEGPHKEGLITALAFPPGTVDTPYCTVQHVQDTDPIVTTIKTPYKDFTPQGTDALKGWMHLNNDQYYLQGFLIGTTPYIYINGQDVTQQIANLLNCLPTDIASCYMDIPLSTIQNLASIQ